MNSDAAPPSSSFFSHVLQVYAAGNTGASTSKINFKVLMQRRKDSYLCLASLSLSIYLPFWFSFSSGLRFTGIPASSLDEHPDLAPPFFFLSFAVLCAALLAMYVFRLPAINLTTSPRLRSFFFFKYISRFSLVTR